MKQIHLLQWHNGDYEGREEVLFACEDAGKLQALADRCLRWFDRARAKMPPKAPADAPLDEWSEAQDAVDRYIANLRPPLIGIRLAQAVEYDLRPEFKVITVPLKK